MDGRLKPSASLCTTKPCWARRCIRGQNRTPNTLIGPPKSGERVLGELWQDSLGAWWRCTAAGTPGTWQQVLPAAVAADPSSGTVPTGYLVLNVTSGTVKRHAGGYVWETQIGGCASARIRFWGATPVAQPSGAAQAAVTLDIADGEIGCLTISDPPSQAEVQALRDKAQELADDVRALSTLVHALRGALVPPLATSSSRCFSSPVP